ncbi:PepSY domain-containing protein [Paucibacter sp. APW11]|uniref:PepSY domain-containing protein n=1 Tax=Roseateles aquae TaxID=3077235 RepID=A0ABU3PGT4_9BURK|nr:PepSY domain-containing protein [Paucibacter sp. APW11]MDT9001679.1 PepSY domain-containing protein [Paucibacter sp. APW11]
MRWSPYLFRWHRWLGYLVALQVVAWIVGGMVFAWLPFQAWVKGEAVLKPAQLILPANWSQELAAWPVAGPVCDAAGDSTDAAQIRGMQLLPTAQGPAAKLVFLKGECWLTLTGRALPAPESAAIAAYAAQLYAGRARAQAPERLTEVPRRLGLVRELGDRRAVWRVRFDDALSTRMYFDARSGAFLAVRSEAWVLYDFFWRLHVMDYTDGEDFNNPLMRAASLAALLLVLSGSALSLLAIRRAWRRSRR